jgi:protein-arginine kinase activator protein McsA
MNPEQCEVCGDPASIHLTEIFNGLRTQHSYCANHAPTDLPKQTRDDEVKTVEKLIANLDTFPGTPERKERLREKLVKFADDIAAGRKKIMDIASVFRD